MGTRAQTRGSRLREESHLDRGRRVIVNPRVMLRAKGEEVVDGVRSAFILWKDMMGTTRIGPLVALGELAHTVRPEPDVALRAFVRLPFERSPIACALEPGHN